jgi:hypothetical protein
MVVTLAGIVTDASPEQPEKACSPMVVTLAGIVTDVSPEQPEKAPWSSPMTAFPPIAKGMVTAPPRPVYFVITTTPRFSVVSKPSPVSFFVSIMVLLR